MLVLRGLMNRYSAGDDGYEWRECRSGLINNVLGSMANRDLQNSGIRAVFLSGIRLKRHRTRQ